ncbi:hypothetical protein LIA77_05313 [Sarocladium implicatum]|nr:hypothetical protein LIA77_05313 [Sarocladium implicatum]
MSEEATLSCTPAPDQSAPSVVNVTSSRPPPLSGPHPTPSLYHHVDKMLHISDTLESFQHRQ